MIRPVALGLVIALVMGGEVQAVETPKGGPADGRIKVVDYDPWQVIRVTGVFRTATQIQFGEDETILHVALGDTTGWDVAAEKNILFVKPKAPRAPTNLIVTTSRGAETRSYTFELTTRSGPAGATTPDTVFVLRFRYPEDARIKARAAISAEEARLAQTILQLKLDRAVVEGPRNLAYAVQGAADLQPSEVSDNGRFTVLRFPGNQPLPAIYEVDGAGTEAIATFDVRGEFLVVHGVARQLRLRRGREVLCIFNQAYAPYGVNPGTGTAAPDVRRTEKATP